MAQTPMAEILMFYPCPSLSDQIYQWARQQTDAGLAVSTSTYPQAVRQALDRAELFLIDATDHPASAMAVLEQAVEMDLASRATVYTEAMYAGLEMFTRLRGSLLLLGPLSATEWEGFFATKRRFIQAGLMGGRGCCLKDR